MIIRNMFIRSFYPISGTNSDVVQVLNQKDNIWKLSAYVDGTATNGVFFSITLDFYVSPNVKTLGSFTYDEHNIDTTMRNMVKATISIPIINEALIISARNALIPMTDSINEMRECIKNMSSERMRDLWHSVVDDALCDLQNVGLEFTKDENVQQWEDLGKFVQTWIDKNLNTIVVNEKLPDIIIPE